MVIRDNKKTKTMTTYEPFAKSVENEPHTALGAAPIENIEDTPLAVPCTAVYMDDYFTGETYSLTPAALTLHQLIREIQRIIAQDYERAWCNYHRITDLCIEVIELHDNGTANVYIGS